MILVDSCGWLQYYQDGPLAQAYTEYLAAEAVCVPTIVLYEVYKIVRRSAPQEVAEEVAAEMRTRRVVPLTDDIAVLAAEVALEHKLAMADAIVLATARAVNAQLVTSDSDLGKLEDVQYLDPGT